MSLLTRFLAEYNKRGLRGAYRLTEYLATHLKSLQDHPIHTKHGTLYVDLRISSARGILANPNSITGEDDVMKSLVKKGDVVFDVGAHLGFYTLLLSRAVGETGKVFAFEPNPELLPSLKRSIAAFPNVVLMEMALSDKQGSLKLFVPEDASMASLEDWTGGSAGLVHTVPCKMESIDNLIADAKLPLPQFIKCDVEGAELSVFKGGRTTLNQYKAPAVLFEINERAAKAFGKEVRLYFELFESFENSNYKFFQVFRHGIEKLKNKYIEFGNVIAIPEARISQEWVEKFNLYE